MNKETDRLTALEISKRHAIRCASVQLTDAIVSALSAAREETKERDAKIADQWSDAATEGDGEVWIAMKIASAIRSSTEGDRHAG